MTMSQAHTGLSKLMTLKIDTIAHHTQSLNERFLRLKYKKLDKKTSCKTGKKRAEG